MGWDQGPLRFSLHEGYWIGLNKFWLVFASVRMNVVRVQISSIDESTINRISVTSAIIFKGRFSEIGSKSTVRDPSRCLFELNKLNST
jgi:hypothetical protein